MGGVVIEAFAREFGRYRRMMEVAAGQVTWEMLRVSLDKETNSPTVIMKHVAGNLRSRWTDALGSDGEKAWRDRDGEFVDDFADRAALMAWWEAGWAVLEGTLATLGDEDLGKVLTIRGEPHTLALALARSVSHTAYHAGQVVQVCRVLASRGGLEWKVMTMARREERGRDAETK